LVGNGDDHDLPAALGIHEAERKAAKKRLSEPAPGRRADSGTFKDRLKCALDVIEKRVP
jgi:hypothetical protein